MAIKSGQPIDRVEMTATTDSTVVSCGASETKEVYSLIFHDHGGAGATVELFLSSDATSAAAERIDNIVIGANETKLANSISVAQSQYLIAKPSAGSINYHGAYTLRNGGDV